MWLKTLKYVYGTIGDKKFIFYCAPKVKAQPTFFTTVNQMYGGSSQLSTTAELAVIKSLRTVQTTKPCSAVVVSWEGPPNI